MPRARCASCRQLHAACGFLAFWPQTSLSCCDLPKALEGHRPSDSLFRAGMLSWAESYKNCN